MNSLGGFDRAVLERELHYAWKTAAGDLTISSPSIETFYVVSSNGQGITMSQRGYSGELSEPATWLSTFRYARNNAQLSSNDASRTFMIQDGKPMNMPCIPTHIIRPGLSESWPILELVMH